MALTGVLVARQRSLAQATVADGRAVVTVTGERGKVVSEPRVVIDEVVRCNSSPCEVSDLTRGVHLARVTASGYLSTAARAFVVGPDERSALDIEMVRSDLPGAAKQPAELKPPERPSRAPGVTSPMELDTSAKPSAPANKSGAVGVRPARKAPARKVAVSRLSGKSPSAAKPNAGASNGTLNISATPRASVVLDGRPLGQTPVAGVRLAPGAHTIVFVRSDGRRNVQVANITAGAKQSIVARF